MRTCGVFHAWFAILAGRVPSLSIEITKECPLRGPGCYSFDAVHLGKGLLLSNLSDFKGNELVLPLLQEHNPLHISFVGGDPRDHGGRWSRDNEPSDPLFPSFSPSTHSRWWIGSPEQAPARPTCTKTLTSPQERRRASRHWETKKQRNQLNLGTLDWCRERVEPYDREGQRILS